MIEGKNRLLNQKQLTPSGVKGNLLAAESFLRLLKDQGPTCIYIAVVVVRRSSHKKKNVP